MQDLCFDIYLEEKCTSSGEVEHKYQIIYSRVVSKVIQHVLDRLHPLLYWESMLYFWECFYRKGFYLNCFNTNCGCIVCKIYCVLNIRHIVTNSINHSYILYPQFKLIQWIIAMRPHKLIVTVDAEYDVTIYYAVLTQSASGILLFIIVYYCILLYLIVCYCIW